MSYNYRITMYHRVLTALSAGLLACSAHAADPTAVITSGIGTSFAEFTTGTVGNGEVRQNTLYFIDEKSGAFGKSWYIFFEPAVARTVKATITFDSDINSAQVFTQQAGLAATDADYGISSVTYKSTPDIGLEMGPRGQDKFVITGNTLTVTLNAKDPGDHLRVFTSPVPEPASFALMAAGLVAVGAAARRRKA